MQKVKKWLDNYGNNFIFINGGSDTWSATSYQPSGKTNAIKIYIKNGSHITARIKYMSDKQKKIVYSALKKWLK